jgi:uncharacterized repeat protein (TIGR03803 family)
VIRSDGNYQQLHQFDPRNEGTSPIGALVQFYDGTLYGVTQQGGQYGSGTLYRADLSGNVRTIYSFHGGQPYSLTQDPFNGEMVGVISAFGGEGAYLFNGNGLTRIHSFTANEGSPVGPIIVGFDGNYYGLTTIGPYRLTKSGQFTLLHQLTAAEGESPVGNLIQAGDQRFYGVATFGGAFAFGTVFSVSSTGDFRVEHTFTGSVAEGGFPLTGLARADDLFPYGTTGLGSGSLFRIGPDGFETLILYPQTLPGGNPNFPSPGVLQGSDGKLYGVQTTLGGSVYVVDAGLPPPSPIRAVPVPASGAVGATIRIIGNNFLGATSVSFNGTPATQFIVTSAQSIFAVVPAGATTGPVTVTTPNGSVTSKKDFTVTG